MSNKISNQTRRKISESMKKAHEEGRAWNIGKSRWNNEPSYPEKFFMKVIENEFNDKKHEREYNVGKYSIDFAWIDKKLAIEIDGAQHKKEEYRERDAKKDKLLIENGWKVLRIDWDNMVNDTKTWIKIAKDFVDNQVDHLILLKDIKGESLDFLLLKQLLGISFKKDSIGRNLYIDSKIIEKQKELIGNSNIDFSKTGWVQEVSKILQITPQKVTNWMKRNMYDFWEEKCFKRKSKNMKNNC